MRRPKSRAKALFGAGFLRLGCETSAGVGGEVGAQVLQGHPRRDGRLKLWTDRESSVTRTGGSRNTGERPAGRNLPARVVASPRPSARGLGRLTKFAGGVVLVGVVGLGLLYLRLIYGPVALNFLAEPIE